MSVMASKKIDYSVRIGYNIPEVILWSGGWPK